MMPGNLASTVDWDAFVNQQYTEQRLSWMQERGFEEAYDYGKRKLRLACLLAVMLGVFGGHRFYLGKRRTAFLMSAITLAGFVVAAIISIFFRDTAVGIIGDLIAGLILLSMCVWVVVDLFHIPSMVRNFNAQLSMEIKLKLRSGFFI
jgi:TM2 domain-containing membrane protein YozV